MSNLYEPPIRRANTVMALSPELLMLMKRRSADQLSSQSGVGLAPKCRIKCARSGIRPIIRPAVQSHHASVLENISHLTTYRFLTCLSYTPRQALGHRAGLPATLLTPVLYALSTCLSPVCQGIEVVVANNRCGPQVDTLCGPNRFKRVFLRRDHSARCAHWAVPCNRRIHRPDSA